MLQKIDNEKRLYIYQNEAGVSSIGFEFCEKRIKAVCEWLALPFPTVEIGTPEYYETYEKLMKEGEKTAELTGMRCNAELILGFIGNEGKMVEVVDMDDITRRFKIGKSTGWMPCHLEIHKGIDGGYCAGKYKSIRILK